MRVSYQGFKLLGAILMLSLVAIKAQDVICPDLMFTEIADPSDLYSARFVELYSTIAGCTIGQHNGKDVYFTTAFNANPGYSYQLLLTGQVVPADGFFIICTNVDNFSIAYSTSSCDLASSLVNSNGDDSYLLIANNNPTGDLTNDEIIDVYGVPGLDPDTSDTTINFQDGRAVRKPGTGPSSVFQANDWTVMNDFDPANAQDTTDMTPREWEGASLSPEPTRTLSPSPAPTPQQTESPCVSIQTIQGNDMQSPYDGLKVRVCNGRITSIVRNGFYIQDPVPLLNSTFSCGVFVYTGSDNLVGLSVGNKMIVFGTVSEFYGNTQIVSSDYKVDPHDQSIELVPATTLTLPVDHLSDFERYEGMYISIEASGDPDTQIIISEYFNFDRYGDVVVCNAKGRIYQYTEINRPDIDGYNQHLSELDRSCVTIDDNNGSQNPNPALFGGIAAYEISKNFTFRGGDLITTLKGPLFYSFSKWRVQPMVESELSFNRTDMNRPPVPDLVEGDIKLVFVNVLNYFTDFTGRGADSQEEFDRQSAKTILALSMLDADIVAVAEIENKGNETANDLVGKMNASTGRTYLAATNEVLVSPEVGDDEIRVDIMYDSKRVTALSGATLTDDDIDAEILAQSPSGIVFNGRSRVPLAVTFEMTTSGERFTVVVTHFKSKSSNNANGNDADKGDGAASYDLTRTLSTLALADWLSRYPTGYKTENVVVIGDMNAYSNEDPIESWYNDKSSRAYYDAIDKVGSSPRPYSYLYSGQVGSLDHAFVKHTSTKFFSVADAAIWNVNADEPDIHDYNLDYGRDESIFNPDEPYRFSDHDPIILSLKFECTDSPFRNSKNEGCEKVMKRPKFCTKTLFSTLCPMSCGLCPCQDSKTYGHKGKGCKFVRRDPSNRCYDVPDALRVCQKTCLSEC